MRTLDVVAAILAAVEPWPLARRIGREARKCQSCVLADHELQMSLSEIEPFSQSRKLLSAGPEATALRQAGSLTPQEVPRD